MYVGIQKKERLAIAPSNSLQLLAFALLPIANDGRRSSITPLSNISIKNHE
jgi:hypothetical protein